MAAVHHYGDTRVLSGHVRHTAGAVCAAIPKRSWDFAVASAKLIAEPTTPGGPIFDYFYVFVAGDPPSLYQVPMELLEPVGTHAFFADLESELQARQTRWQIWN